MREEVTALPGMDDNVGLGDGAPKRRSTVATAIIFKVSRFINRKIVSYPTRSIDILLTAVYILHMKLIFASKIKIAAGCDYHP